MKPLLLKDAPGGAAYLTSSADTLRTGRRAFAENCASCHSSKQPPAGTADRHAVVPGGRRARRLPDGQFPFRRQAIFRHRARHERRSRDGQQRRARQHLGAVLFGNLQGAAERRAVDEPVQPARPDKAADARNSRRRSAATIERASLTSIWATAPYLHNNSVGIFVKDPSVQGRMTAFTDGMVKMLWPERRLGVQSIPVTTVESTVTISGTTRQVRIPAGTPVDYVARVDPTRLPDIVRNSVLLNLFSDEAIYRRMLRNNLAPDFILDQRPHLRRADAGRRQVGAHRVPEDILRGARRDARRHHLHAAAVPEPDGQEPHLPVEHLGSLRQLRRLGQPGAHQLGSEVRQGRRGRHHLVVRAGAPPRPHRAELRDDRRRLADPVLAGARTGGARARLQVHPAAQPFGPAARHQRDRGPDRTELDRQGRSDPWLPVRADDHRADPRGRSGTSRRAPGARARRASTAWSSTAPTDI